MRAVIILPYFGKFPNYFELFLKTVQHNKTINWLIITDDATQYNYPENVTVVRLSFAELKAKFQSKFDFEINLDRPHKLCDYKPTLGYVLEEYLKGYDYWGHCDPDILWGNFDTFIDFEALKNYDKLFLLGHLSFYKNTPENNSRFFKQIKGFDRYKQVFTNPIGYAFDENFKDSINTIFKEHQFSVFTENVAADIDPYYSNMHLSLYNSDSDSYLLDTAKNIFVWDNGKILRYFIKNGLVICEEFLYIHLQKRAMKLDFDIQQYSKILIQSDAFVPLTEDITIENFNTFYQKKYFNFQFFKIKWGSLKYKIKYRKYFYA